MENDPKRRASLFFEKYINGKRLSADLLPQSVIDSNKELDPHFGERESAQFDLLYFTRLATATGMVFNDLSECNRCGCEWLIPFGFLVDTVATSTWIVLNTKTKEDFEKIKTEEGKKELLDKYNKVWLLSPREMARIEDNEEWISFHLKVRDHMFNTDGTIKDVVLPPDEDHGSFFMNKAEDFFELYKHTKEYLRKICPYKELKIEKDLRHDILMWDGRKFTDLKLESIDKLLEQEGYSFRMNEYYGQPREGMSVKEIQKEMEDKRIIRSMTISQLNQKAISRTNYATKIHRVSKMCVLIKMGIVQLEIVRNDKTYLKDEHWIDDEPKVCLTHLVPDIVKIVPKMTKVAQEYWSTFKVDSLRSAEHLFDEISKEFGMLVKGAEFLEWTDKDIDG